MGGGLGLGVGVGVRVRDRAASEVRTTGINQILRGAHLRVVGQMEIGSLRNSPKAVEGHRTAMKCVKRPLAWIEFFSKSDWLCVLSNLTDFPKRLPSLGNR